MPEFSASQRPRVGKYLDILYVLFLTVTATVFAHGTQAIQTSTEGDSGVYLFVAQSVLDGNGILSPTGAPLTIFPPGYPLLLAALGSFGLTVISAASVLNLVSIALLIPCTFLLGKMTLTGRLLPLAAATLITTAPANYRVFSNAWSEPTFTVLMLMVILLLTFSIRRKSAPWWIVVVLTIFINVATGLRFVGVLMIPVAVLTIFYLTYRHKQFVKPIFLLIASSLSFLVIGIRNLVIGVGFMGDRTNGALSFQGAIEQFVKQLGVYIAPPESTSLTQIAGTVVLVALLVSIWLIFINRDSTLYPTALYFLLFWGVIVWSQTSTRIDVNPERLGSPAFVPVILLCLYSLHYLGSTVNEQLSSRLGKQVSWANIAITGSVLVVVISVNLVNSLRLLT